MSRASARMWERDAAPQCLRSRYWARCAGAHHMLKTAGGRRFVHASSVHAFHLVGVGPMPFAEALRSAGIRG